MEGDGEEVEASKKGPKVEEERERKRRRQEEMAEGGGGGGSGKRHKYVETGLVFMAFLLLVIRMLAVCVCFGMLAATFLPFIPSLSRQKESHHCCIAILVYETRLQKNMAAILSCT